MLLPRANSLTSELSRPQVETGKLTRLSRDVMDLQKQVTSLKSLVKSGAAGRPGTGRGSVRDYSKTTRPVSSS